MFEVGQTFGDFEILECLGQGGAGTMYKARQISAERIVALKAMRGAAGTAPDVVVRFRRDAEVVLALHHPDLVQAFASGETDGVHWVAMEFVEGTNARARLKRKGKLALPEAIAIATHVAGALDHGWRKARIIHGDVEPETILLSKKSEVKLAGLGFGHDLGDVKPFAAEGVPSGAAYYVSPERAEGKKDADFRADIYSLGCTLFHLISGEPPYPGDTALAVILHHCTMPVPQLHAVCPECPPEISRMVMKMMHKLPSGRHQSYDELIADLRLCYEVLTSAPKVVAAALPAPAQAVAEVPPRESIGLPVAVPIAKPAPSRESIPAAMQQRTAAAKLDVPPSEPVKVAVMPPEETDDGEPEEPGGKRRRLAKPLIIGAGALAGAIIALVCIAPWKGEQLSEAQRAERHRASGKLTPIPKPSPVLKPSVAKTTPATPKLVPVRTPPPLAPQFAGPAQRGITPEHVAMPQKREEAPPEPTALTMPTVPTAPVAPVVPAAPDAPQSATAKWIAEQEPQWRAAYAGEVGGPFGKALADLNARHLASVERELATLPAAEERTSAVAFRAERTRISASGTVPAEDESMAPPSLRAMRANYRTAFAKLDAERFAKAKAVHARYDAILSKSQAALTQKLRTAEAQEIQALRDSLRDAWLKPPAGSAAAATDASTTTPDPGPPRPAPAAPPAPKLPKLAPRQLAERLLAMGATFSTGSTGALKTIGKMADLPADRFAIVKVEFIPREGLSTAELDIIEQLMDAEELLLTGVPATDTTIKMLRSLPSLRVLTLRDLKNVTAAGFRSLATLPSLKTLTVRGPIGAESLSAFAADRKLEILTLSDVTFAEPDFAAIASIPTLKTLTIVTRDPVAPPAWGRLASAKKLTTLNLEKTPKTSEMIAHLGRIAPLTSLSLGDVALPDADLAPLGALKHLQTLKTGADSTLDGSVFAAWPLHPAMRTLTFASTKSASDKALRGIATAFPNLTTLDVHADAGSVTPAGLTHFQRLKKLTHLHFTGDAMDTAALGHLVTFDQVTHLGLGSARLTEADVRVLAKFGSLRELEWFNPPVTDEALKGYAKLRTLTQFKIGTKAKPEVAEKLAAALPMVKILQ